MVAWTGLEHFRVGIFNPPPPRLCLGPVLPPPAIEPDDFVVASWRGVRTGEKRSSFFENRTRSSLSYFNHPS
ncbi:hypothetical protein F2Q68_00024416 [Brassica cretica]|uniref:Uncharacterized protein n=1 Tax=Brassica cretica TaxID=69181 RepID=A0A8S9IBU7_BRACR|nr:hypothetical protein F2Q68_00024416 [Brassica cretica]